MSNSASADCKDPSYPSCSRSVGKIGSLGKLLLRRRNILTVVPEKMLNSVKKEETKSTGKGCVSSCTTKIEALVCS